MISQSTCYALYALACLDGPNGQYRRVNEVAKTAQIPGPYLQKIFNTLRKRGLILAQRGIGGGVKLTRNPKEISVFEVCAAMEDVVVQPRCVLGLAECRDDAPCPSHEFWTKIRPKILSEFEKMDLAGVNSTLRKKGYRLRRS